MRWTAEGIHFAVYVSWSMSKCHGFIYIYKARPIFWVFKRLLPVFVGTTGPILTKYHFSEADTCGGCLYHIEIKIRDPWPAPEVTLDFRLWHFEEGKKWRGKYFWISVRKSWEFARQKEIKKNDFTKKLHIFMSDPDKVKWGQSEWFRGRGCSSSTTIK